jgi:16S rRNA (cytidine1402-2'-O)-methyltransferase
MGRLFVVATPIGNLADISERALTTLKAVHLVAAEDTRRTRALLNHFGLKTKLISYRQHNEREKSQELTTRILADGIDVALVTDAGTPCISDPGCLLVAAAREKGIEVVAIPGASAVTAALSVCGFDFKQFSFLGFIPRAKKDKEAFYHSIATSQIITHVMYESPQRIVGSLKEIAAALPACSLFVANDITKYYERAYYGEISEVQKQIETAEKAELGEYTLVLQKKPTSATPASEESTVSIEALLVEEMVKSDCSLKEAIAKISENKGFGKNEVYKASLALKSMFEKNH